MAVVRAPIANLAPIHDALSAVLFERKTVLRPDLLEKLRSAMATLPVDNQSWFIRHPTRHIYQHPQRRLIENLQSGSSRV